MKNISKQVDKQVKKRHFIGLIRRILSQADISIQEKLDQLTLIVTERYGVNICSIYLAHLDQSLELYASTGLSPAALHKCVINSGQGLVSKTFLQKHFVIVEDVFHCKDYFLINNIGEEGNNFFLGISLIERGQAIGCFVIQHARAIVFTQDDLSIFQSISQLVSNLLVSAKSLDKLHNEEIKSLFLKSKSIRARPIVDGIAIGKAVFYEPPQIDLFDITQDVNNEIELLEEAFNELDLFYVRQINDPGLFGSSREVVDTHKLLSGDRSFRKKIQTIIEDGYKATSAIAQVQREYEINMSKVRDQYIRDRYKDIEDITHRLLFFLNGESEQNIENNFLGKVLIARTLGPTELLFIRDSGLVGLITQDASKNSHTAIVARSLGIPFVGGFNISQNHLKNGELVVFDGRTGDIHLRPKEEIISLYNNKFDDFYDEHQALKALSLLKAISLDGVKVNLFLNASLTEDIKKIKTYGISGIGLFRTELPFLIGAALPTLKEQIVLYKQALNLAGDKPITFRLADIGSDKVASYMKIVKEDNPAMGWRGIRLSLDRPGILRTQLRALFYAHQDKECSILIPMISSIDELKLVIEFINKEKQFMRKKNILIGKVRLGVMIENLAAIWSMQEFAPFCDFFSIGGNDLFQFTFAIDRNNKKVNNRFSILHPAFLLTIKHIIKNAKKINKPLNYCGEQINDPIVVLALVALGIKSFSLQAMNIFKIKQVIRESNIVNIRRIVLKGIKLRSMTIYKEISLVVNHKINNKH